MTLAAGRRRRRRAPPSARLWTRATTRRTALLVVGAILSINGLVRASGGHPSWLSPRYLPDKSRALLLLGAHWLRHAGGDLSEGSLERTVARAARAERVPIRLALAVARAESGFSPHAISHTGAMGLMQLMPGTAREVEVRDPFDPSENARGGSRYLRVLLKRYGGDARRAIWAYNTGPNNVPRRGPVELPPETRAYGEKVLRGGLLIRAAPATTATARDARGTALPAKL